jgi:hypothetical protein
MPVIPNIEVVITVSSIGVNCKGCGAGVSVVSWRKLK